LKEERASFPAAAHAPKASSPIHPSQRGKKKLIITHHTSSSNFDITINHLKQ